VSLSVFISAGETSGDQHAAGLCRALQQQHGPMTLTGVGDQAMAQAGVTLLSDQTHMRQLGTIGLLRSVPYHWALAKRVLAHLRQTSPDVIILVDYGGFHLRLARAIRQQLPQWRGKLVYFIPPQLWASRAYRINTLKHTVDLVLGILPFERSLYQQAGVPYQFVGHPVTACLPPAPPDRLAACHQLGVSADRPILAVFPGSRRSELHALLPVIDAALRLIQASVSVPVQVVLAQAPGVDLQPVQQAWGKAFQGHMTVHVTQDVHMVQAIATAAIVKSGTSTLETAWYGTPQVIIYKAHPVSFWVYQAIATVPCVGLPNLLLNAQAGDLPYPELLQHDLTPPALAQHVLDLLTPDTPQAQRQRQAHTDLHHVLQPDGITVQRESPYTQAARAILALLPVDP
jgi:lipid-A-disaccharide synthase